MKLARGMMVAIASLAGCSLFTNLDGFSSPADGTGGDAGDAAIAEGAAADAPHADAGDDARADSGKYDFFDDFARVDTTSGIGNAWQEKTPALRISGQTALRHVTAPGGDYRNNIASRPATESVGDVEVDVTVRFTTGGYAQVHARVQTATLAATNTLDSYIFFYDLNFSDLKTFTIARQRGSALFTTLTSFKMAQPVDFATVYRLRLRVTGVSPVTLVGTVESLQGAAATPLASATVEDTDPTAIVTAGTCGLSGGNDDDASFSYDDFHAFAL